MFAAENAKVAVTDIDTMMVQAVAQQITSAGKTARSWTLDVAAQTEVDNVITAVARHFGGIDILINNAGISRPGAIDDANYLQRWQDSIATMLTAHVYTIKAALPYLRAAANGRIINLASTEGLGATKYSSAYSAAKTGVIGLTRSLAVELGIEGITVNCVCPGPVRTAMTQAIAEQDKAKYARRRVALQRYAEPEEIAQSILSLALPAASFITGVALPVDGGLTIRNA